MCVQHRIGQAAQRAAALLRRGHAVCSRAVVGIIMAVGCMRVGARGAAVDTDTMYIYIYGVKCNNYSK